MILRFRCPLLCSILLLSLPLHAQAQNKIPKVKPPIKLDLYGDPLPEGAIARLGTIRFRHIGRNSGFKFSPTGKTIATSGYESIRFWDKETGRVVHEIPESASHIAYSPDGSHLLVAGRIKNRGSYSFGHIRLYDVKKRKFVWNVRPHIDNRGVVRVNQKVGFFPDGKKIVSLGADHSIKILDASTGLTERVFNEFQNKFKALNFAISRDGSKIAVATRSLIRIWDLEINDPPVEIEIPHRGSLEVMVFAGDSNKLISAGFSQREFRDAAGEFTNYINTPSMHLWNSDTGERLSIFPVDADHGECSELSVTADGKTLISCHDFGFVCWDIQTQRKTRTIHANRLDQTHGRLQNPEKDPVLAAIKGNGRSRIWQMTTGKKWFDEEFVSDNEIRTVAYSPAGTYVATAYAGGTVHVWDLRTAKPKYVFHHSTDRTKASSAPREVAFSPDGETLLAAGWANPRFKGYQFMSGFVQSRNLNDGKMLWTTKFKYRCTRMAISPDSRLIAVGLDDHYDLNFGISKGKGIEILDFKTGKRKLKIAGHLREIKALKFSPDGKRLFSAGKDNTIRIWSTETGKEIGKIVTKNDFDAATISADGQIAATAKDHVLTFWDLKKQKVLFECVDSRFEWRRGAKFMEFSPDNKYLAAGCFRTIELLTGKVSQFPQYSRFTLGVAFSSDGSKLASSFSDGSSLIWNIADAPVVGKSAPIDSTTFQNLWQVLAKPNAGESYRAIFRLANSGDASVSFLSKYMQPVKDADPAEIKKLLSEIDHNTFKTRLAAYTGLKKLDRLAMEAVEATLDATRSKEVKLRCRDLLKAARSSLVTGTEQIRQHRAIQVLEKIGSPKAKALLERLASGVTEARQTIEAKRILKRWNSQ